MGVFTRFNGNDTAGIGVGEMNDLEIIIWLQWALILLLIGFCIYVFDAFVELSSLVRNRKTYFIIDGKAYILKDNKLVEVEK